MLNYAPWVKDYQEKERKIEQEYLNYLESNKHYSGELPSKEQWLSIKQNNHTLTDLGGKPSNEKTLNEKAKNYWKPIKGAGLRYKTSMENKTNPYWGINTMTKTAAVAGGLSGLGYGIKYGLPFLRTVASQPHGWLNLAVSIGTDLAAGTVGSTVGTLADKAIGGDGAVGGTLFGIGSVYGFNKTAWKKDLNLALTRAHTTPAEIDEYIISRGGTKGGYKQEGDMTLWYDDYKPGDPTLTFIEGPNNLNQLLRFSERPSAEMHLGGNGKAPNKEAVMWSARIAKELPSGTYVSPYGNAMSRILRMQTHGVFSSKPKMKSFIPATTDGYAAAIKTGNSKNMGFALDFAENYYMNGFHNEIGKTTDTQLRLLYNTFINNPSKDNLNAFNKYLIELGGKPALYINGELKIPLPVLFKK